MTTFAVTLERISYVTVYVEAEDREDAEGKAWESLDTTTDIGEDASWTCASVNPHPN